MLLFGCGISSLENSYSPFTLQACKMCTHDPIVSSMPAEHLFVCFV